jgi:hypothetical protein
MKQITHEDGDLMVVMRELTGADVLDRPSLTRALALTIATPLGKVDAKGNIDLPNRIWGRIGQVIGIIQQTVESKGPLAVPSVDAPDKDIFDFYIFLTTQPGQYVEFLQAALKKVNADPAPNPSGGGG